MIRVKNNLASENLAKVAPGCKLFHVEQRLADEKLLVAVNSTGHRPFSICSTWNSARGWRLRETYDY